MKNLVIFLTAIFLFSCASTSQDKPSTGVYATSGEVDGVGYSAPSLFYPLVEEFTNSLNKRGILTNLTEHIAPTSFVWIRDYKLIEKPDALGYLGFNIEESMISALKQQGVLLNDYKLKSLIQLDGEGSYVLDKSQQNSRPETNAKYVLTGVIAPIEGGANVTAKVINFETGDIVSSATAYFPLASQFNRRVYMIDGKIHRN